MHSKGLFWCFVIFLFGGLITIGFVFAEHRLFFGVIEGFTLLALLFTIILYRQLVKPYKILISGMELLKEQDFSTRLRHVGHSEADQLINVFNQMICRLREERLLVRETNQFLDLLVKASPQGIIILDFDDFVTNINPAGVDLLHLKSAADAIGKKPGELTCELASHLAVLKPGENVVIRSSTASMYRCMRRSFIDKGFNHPFILIEELTRELLKVEKQSYEKIIRLISHEVNNSTGAIGSTLDVISSVMRSSHSQEWDDVLPVIDTSALRCRHLSNFVASLASVIKIPLPKCSHTSVNELVQTVKWLVLTECIQREIELIVSLSDMDYQIYADPIQMEQVLVNIVKNAYESIREKGTIEIRVNQNSISITDDGPGISPENKDKLFSSFFTTKSTGHGLGLLFVREVLINHQFRFDLRTERDLTTFRIAFKA